MANQLITDANARADNMLSTAQQFINELSDLSADDIVNLSSANTLGVWDSGLYDIVSIDDVGTLDTAALTGLVDLDKTSSIDIPAPPTTDYYTATLPTVWAAAQIPELTDVALEITAPVAPTVITPTAPVAHQITPVTIPVWDTIALPAEVEIFEPILSAPSVLEISNIDLAAPDMNLILPTNSFSYEEETYSSELLSSVTTLLAADITDGGYGINPDDEQELYARGREREARKAAASVVQARKGIAARGFPVPPGSLYAVERVILKEGAVALSELNRDIVIKRSELYLAARQFAVQQGLNLEQVLITYTGAKQERMLKALQIAGDFAIQFHNTAVGLFNLKVESKQLELAIHREQLAVATLKLQEYGQQLSFVDMHNKKNQLKLQHYTQQLETVKIFYEAQRAEEEHAKLFIEIERLKLQANQNQVSVYATQVKAASDEYEIYRTAWSAEETKQKVFAQQLAAHNQKIDGVVKASQIEQDRFSAQIDLVKVERERQAMALDQHKLRLSKASISSDALRQSNAELTEIWKTNRAAGQFNIEAKFRKNVEHVNKYLEAQKTNIAQLAATVGAVINSKELKGNSAQAALLMYTEALKNEVPATSTIVTAEG